jgi:BirA family transcriptional regulator, biotin operon repressor / biotin---[acetyl-CoA-carboxylase] ligase
VDLSPVRLSPKAEAGGTRLEHYDSIGSTNDEAMARARAGDAGRLWIVADEQTKGRGRSGRPWSSPRGNLLASLLLRAPCPPAASPQIGFVAAVALHQALREVTGLPGSRLALKWPNDVLLDGAKLAGILVEGTTVPNARGQGDLAVVLGFGVNLVAHPPDTPYPATDCAQAGVPVTRGALFAALSERILDGLSLWREGAGFADIRLEWLARAQGLGKPILVRRPEGDRRGTFRDLDGEGRLLLEDSTGLTVIQAGDVFPIEGGARQDRNKERIDGR